MLKNKLFQRWTLANALAELFGLGLTFVITGLVFSKLDNQQTITNILLSFVFAMLSGGVEATVVGLAQWWAMHPWFSMVSRFAWWRGTLIGALIAYVLGYLPSTLMSMGEAATQSTPGSGPNTSTFSISKAATRCMALGADALLTRQDLVETVHTLSGRPQRSAACVARKKRDDVLPTWSVHQ